VIFYSINIDIDETVCDRDGGSETEKKGAGETNLEGVKPDISF